jgi:hypothetical protein
MKKLFSVSVTMVVLLFVCADVFGDLSYSPVMSLPNGEANHAEILADIYGGTFISDGVNYNSEISGIQALRVYDAGDDSSRLNPLTGTPDDVDQIWTDGLLSITAKAKYAGYDQAFGWNGGGTGTTYHQLLTAADIGGGGVMLDVTGDFLWGLLSTSGSCSEQWWSMDEKNNYEDHMVTYEIEGLAGAGKAWLIFMEDLPLGQSDKDYNDFVVEIAAAPEIVPEPATIALLCFGGLLLRKRK